MNKENKMKPFQAIKSNTEKVLNLGSKLQDLNVAYQDVLIETQQLSIDLQSSQNQYWKQRELCDSQNCNSSMNFKNTIANNEITLQRIASTLKEFLETKNYNTIKELLKELCIKSEILTPPKDSPERPNDNKENISNVSGADIDIQDASVSEIEGTPGRTSPVLHSKMSRSKVVDTDLGGKKKSCGSWLSPDTKLIKLDASPRTRARPAAARPDARADARTPGRPRQSRLVVVARRATQLVDLTCSPEMSIKKESLEGDDTILPSPTSSVLQPVVPESLRSPFKRPAARAAVADMDESINLLQPYKLPMNSPRKPSLSLKSKNNENAPAPAAILEPIDKDETCIDNASLSLLRASRKLLSPKKEPLSENMNATNTSPTFTEPGGGGGGAGNRPRPAEAPVCNAPVPRSPPVHERAPRRAAEKRALPGWSCDECRTFYGELHSGDEPVLRRLMEACSRHRARGGPRPATPPGYWRPRWSVPDDTAEFNRMNGAE